ncbi:MAG: ribosome recycling factor [Candidatus Eisenbacteria bacterium]|nr:ribosome recycling factor [Candidatus Eisenbacteria bacterium]
MPQKILAEAEERMKKAIEGVRHEFSGIRTGKASAGLLDTVKVEAYGSSMSLVQVASVSAPEPRLLVIQPYDKGLIKAITKGINESNLGLSPQDDGQVVRIPIPSLTEERRKDLVKLISKFAEEGRVHIRQVRHDMLKVIKEQEKEGLIPGDDSKHLQTDAQKLTDKYTGQIEEMLKKKTAEIMEV